MPYRALYRQWRPKDFSHVVGQRAVIETLRNQVINDRIAHAYLFCGSRGTGKTSTAKILARAINCENPQQGDPCGNCPNCLRMENDESLDVIEIDAASNNGVDEMRDLRDTVKYPPQYGKYKVYIIDEVHMLSTSAFNALLKTLEEPPAHIVFILATTEPQKLPETILSRCQRFDFGRLSVSEITGRLREAAEGSGATVSSGALTVIARSAEGGMRDALSLLDMCLGYGDQIDEEMVRSILGSCDQAFLFRFVQYIADENTEELFRMIDQVMRDGRDPSVFIRDISYHLRTLMLAKCSPDGMMEILDLTEEDANEFRQQAESFSVTRLMTVLDLYMRSENEMRFSSSPRLILETVSLKCCIRTTEPDMQALSDRISELEKELKELKSSGFVQPQKSTNQTAGELESVSSGKAPSSGKPAAKKTSSVSSNQFDQVWSEVMKHLSREEPALWSILTQGSASLKGRIVQWTPSKADGSEYYIPLLNKEEKKNRIIQCVNDITSENYSFEAAASFDAEKSENHSDEQYIHSLYDAFGKEPVSIVE